MRDLRFFCLFCVFYLFNSLQFVLLINLTQVNKIMNPLYKLEQYSPSFIVSQDPNRFLPPGSSMTPEQAHQLFLEESEEFIESTKKELEEAVQNKADIEQIFLFLFKMAGLCRQKIACLQGTPSYQLFGRERYIHTTDYDVMTSLILGGPYEKFKMPLVDFFKSLIGAESYVEIRNNSNNRNSLLVLQHIETTLADLKQNRVPKNIPVEEVWEIRRWNFIRDGMLTLNKLPGFSDNEETTITYLHICLSTADQESGDYQKKLPCEYLPLTDYLIRTTNDGTPMLIMINQDPGFVEATQQKIATIFSNAIQWNSQTQTISDLKNTMAHFCYLSTHSMNYFRGTAAITEWFSHIVFRLHGFNYIDDKSTMVDLEALANPLFGYFKKRYLEIIKLEAKSSGRNPCVPLQEIQTIRQPQNQQQHITMDTQFISYRLGGCTI